MKEEWRDIEGYEGLYQVSNKGRIKSLSRERTRLSFQGKGGCLRERILKSSLTSDGYEGVILYKTGQRKSFKVHKLVVEAFIETQSGKLYVNHMDGNKENNNVLNLERCTPQHNVKHAYENGLNKWKIDIDLIRFRDLAENKGLSAKEMSEIFECDAKTIRNRARKHGIKIKSPARSKQFHINKDMLKEKLKIRTQREVAKEIGCSESLIHLYAKQIRKEDE